MAPQRRFGCLCATLAALLAARSHGLTSAAAVPVVPLSAVRAASRCTAAPDAVDCLLRAAAAGVDALSRSAEPVDLVPGVVALVKYAAADAGALSPSPPPTTTTTTTTTRPLDAGAASVPSTATAPAADGVPATSAVSAEAALVDSITAFARSRAISVRAPAHLLDSLKTTLTEARGKKDKYAGPLLMGAMMVAGTLLPIKLGALAMMSGKALMTSMLALMLSAILALKKLASGGGGSHGGTTTYEVINVPSHGAHGPHGRSLQAHGLAYGPPPVDPIEAAATVADVPQEI